MLLELGNATPVIVHGDADLDEAAAKLAANAFSFAGQSCISVQRIYVQKWVYDEFVARFVPQVEQLVLGDPADEDDRRRAGDRRRRARADPELDRGGAGRRAPRSSPAAARRAISSSRR